MGYIEKIIFGLLLSVYLLEVVGKKYNDYDFVRPSAYLQTAATFAMDTLYNFGNAVANVFTYQSDLLDFIDFKFFVVTFGELFKPLFQLFTSPVYFVWGYLEGLSEYSYPATIFICSVVFATSLVVLFEFIMRRKVDNYKPSKLILFLSRVAEYVYGSLGKYFAYISSFYHVVIDLFSLEEFALAVYDLAKAGFRFVASPFFAVKGYFKTLTSYKYPALVGWGTVTLFLTGCYYFTQFV
ncbi:MAG: hypothetical protein Terrestrivirus5_32 [Terrestrivirus sp.]|uniref:Uncharacterized protein n=1 Tax=Terrestrivirus sp. TaxID=2487775 RepID=A0A3G4ZMX1_9VIRU|nr:MAG: hypothetical protein Terrestrivirus5_32 [Terrestrivirus sp.]